MLFSSFCCMKYFSFSGFFCLTAQAKLVFIWYIYYMDIVSYQCEMEEIL